MFTFLPAWDYRSQSYFTTGGQSVSMSWCRAHPGTSDHCLRVEALYLWGALSDDRTDLQFLVQSLNGPSRAEPVTILYCLIRDSPNMEGQVSIFISPRNTVAQLYSWVLGSLFVACYDSQGYGGSILTSLHPLPDCSNFLTFNSVSV
jgi:hypothetical protein